MTARPPASALPSLPDLLGPDLPRLLGACREHAGPITATDRIHDGNVSHVFRIHGETNSVILKVRTDRYARIPDLRTDPTLIEDERRALVLYGGYEPAVFPQVLGFHAPAHAMILSDVFPGGRSYHAHLRRRPATTAEMNRLGTTLRRIHHATRTTDPAFRTHSTRHFQERAFLFCLRATGHDRLARACDELAALPGQRLVLGDLAPKNLHLTAGRLTICDLDNVHLGWPPYDVAYFLAHLLIHHLGRAEPLQDLVAALLTAYFAGLPPHARSTEAQLMATVTAGVILYRLDQTVPYPLPAPASLTGRYRVHVEQLLHRAAFTLQDLVDAASIVREQAP